LPGKGTVNRYTRLYPPPPQRRDFTQLPGYLAVFGHGSGLDPVSIRPEDADLDEMAHAVLGHVQDKLTLDPQHCTRICCIVGMQ
jgi:hypothetical protein